MRVDWRRLGILIDGETIRGTTKLCGVCLASHSAIAILSFDPSLEKFTTPFEVETSRIQIKTKYRRYAQHSIPYSVPEIP